MDVINILCMHISQHPSLREAKKPGPFQMDSFIHKFLERYRNTALSSLRITIFNFSDERLVFDFR